MKIKRICALFLLLPVVFSLAGCGQEASLEQTGFYFNTPITITIYHSNDSSLLQECETMCAQMDLAFSRTNPQSSLYQLNQAAHQAPLSHYPISSELYTLLEQGLRMHEASHGAFSVSLEPVTSLWDFTSSHPVPPNPEAITEALSFVDDSLLTLHPEDCSLSTKKAGMGLDLGALVKGYAADALLSFLVEKNVTSALIDLGGNIMTLGKNLKGETFSIGIQDPQALSGTALLSVSSSPSSHSSSVVTSGTYQRNFTWDGVFYHHILDSSTGYPVQNNLSSVSILSDSSLDGDALSTACFAMGLSDGLALIEETPEVEAVFITTQGEIILSSGLSLEGHRVIYL